MGDLLAQVTYISSQYGTVAILQKQENLMDLND